ncbi:MAG: glycosyltransferase, partial [Acidimicrobiales bacterium]
MRVLHVNKFLYRRGGAEAYLLDLAGAQAERGDAVALYGMRHPDNAPSPYSTWFPDRVEFTATGLAGRVGAVGRMMWSTAAQRGIEHVLRRHRPDVAHLHNIYHHLSPSILRPIAAAGVPIVLTMHDYKLVCPSYQLLDHGRPCEACLGGSLLEPVRRRCKDGSLMASAAVALETASHRAIGAYDPVNVLVSPSAYLAGKMVAGGVDRDRIQICPLFTDAAPAGDEPSEGIGSRRVAFVGRLEPEKGVGLLIQSVAELPDLSLWVAGDGSAAAQLQALGDRLAPSRVRFLGRLDRSGVRSLLASAQTVAVPSTWPENQPLSVLEAIAAGAPVVASDVGGIPEIIEHDRSGLLVPPGDQAALTAALGRIDGDRHLAAALSSSGRRRAGDFSLATHLARLDEIYEMAGAASASGRRRRLIDGRRRAASYTDS